MKLGKVVSQSDARMIPTYVFHFKVMTISIGLGSIIIAVIHFR